MDNFLQFVPAIMHFFSAINSVSSWVVFLGLITLGICTSVATAQSEENDATDPLAEVLAGHSFHGSAFNEGARQSSYIMGGTGNVDFNVTTDSKQAQAFFRQGVGQLHGFWDLEAERSFRQAAVIDPDCAMAYWGAALATFEKTERSASFVQEAFERIDSCSDREKAYIKALHRYFHGESKKKPKANDDGKAENREEDNKKDTDSKDENKKDTDSKDDAKASLDPVNDSNKKNRAARYLKDLEDISIDFPDDIEAKALIVHRIWYNTRAGHPISSFVSAESLLKEIFAVNPLHPAHHYRIHLWDRRKPEQAIESAGMCGLSAPRIAHMWHMPGHIFSRLHRYDDAAYYQEASARTDHHHMMTDLVIPDQIHNYAHNNEWLTRNYVFLGRARDALRMATNLIELPRHPKYNAFGIDRNGSIVYGQKRLLQILREFQLFDQLEQFENAGYFLDLDEERQIDLLRAKGCFAAIQNHDQSTADVREQLQTTAETTDTELEEAEATVTSLTDELKAFNDAKKNQKNEKKKNVDDESEESKSEQAQRCIDPDFDPATKGDQLKKQKKEVKRLKKQKEKIEKALKAIDGYEQVAAGELAEACELLEEAGDEDKSWIAELRFVDGDKETAINDLKELIKKGPHQSIPLARLAWCLSESGDNEEAAKIAADLHRSAPDADSSVAIFERLESMGDKPESKDTVATAAHFRPAPESLGPLHWSPVTAPKWEVNDSSGELASTQTYSGRNYILIFYLGHGCLHCAEQLQAFGPRSSDFSDIDIEMFAISSDDRKGLEKSIANFDGELPIRLASDPKLEIFKAFRAHDDFENQPLHGTFLIDANGRIRWQDVSYEPFMDVDFLLTESKRLLQFGNNNETQPTVDSAAGR